MRTTRRRPSRRFAVIVAGMAVAAEGLAVRRRGSGLGGNVIVRCRQGHLFTTIWIPGISLKALRLGGLRFQRCPVGRHVSFVTPVSSAALTAEERRVARERRDVRLP